MKIEQRSVQKLSSDPANARKHSERNIESIVASLRRFGQQKPIVVDKSGVVRAGNGTLEAAKRLGWETIAVVESDLVGADMSAYAIADNRTAELAEWDDEILKATLEGLDDALREAAGFDLSELDELLKEADFSPGTENNQGQLDELEPKNVTCPNCKKEFDCRGQI